MRQRAPRLLLAALVVAVAVGCDAGRGQPGSPEPEPTETTATPADVSEHESGPESTIAYGFIVPEGATQLGPLVRYRSDRLIDAYQPQLDAALAQQEAERRERRQEQLRERRESDPDATLPPFTPPPTPQTQPSSDTFRPLEDPPKPDSTISVMRLDGDPTEVLRLMLAQIDAVLPQAGIVTDDIGEYCQARDRRVTRCRVEATGTTDTDRDLRVSLRVDPGNLRTRTSPAGAETRPVMSLTVEYIGDPRLGQLDRSEDFGIDVPDEVEGRDASDLVWPSMDLDAMRSEPVLNDWVVPQGATLLLSGDQPSFVVLTTDFGRQADTLAREWVSTVGKPRQDVVEDLNEITTTYRAESKNGARALASYVLSARGNYAMLFYTPAETS